MNVHPPLLPHFLLYDGVFEDIPHTFRIVTTQNPRPIRSLLCPSTFELVCDPPNISPSISHPFVPPPALEHPSFQPDYPFSLPQITYEDHLRIDCFLRNVSPPLVKLFRPFKLEVNPFLISLDNFPPSPRRFHLPLVNSPFQPGCATCHSIFLVSLFAHNDDDSTPT